MENIKLLEERVKGFEADLKAADQIKDPETFRAFAGYANKWLAKTKAELASARREG